MSVRRTEVSSVRFEINARPASVSMEALQAKADDLNKDIDIVKKNIADLGNVSPEHEGLKSYQKQLADLNKKLKDVQTTMKDYTRGVKAADELLKAYDAGNIESLSMKAIKAGQNGLKKRIENIKPETANEEELKAYRIITEVIRESQRVVDTFKTDAKETIEILEQGGTVAEATLKKTRDGVRDLMQTTKEGSKEYRDYQKQFEFLADKMKQMETESARVSGQKMLGRAFRGDFATADKKTLEEVIAKLREYQSVIDDPNGKGARIFAAAETQIKNLQASLDKLKMGFSNADEVMQRFNQHLGEPKIETATQQTEKLAQTLDEKLNAATSEYDDNIKYCLESIDYWEKELKKSEDKVASLEAEYNNLVKLLNSGNPFKRLQGEMKGGWKRANNIQSWLEGDESDDNYGWRPAVNDAKNNIRSWKEDLDYWKKQKAEALGLNEAEEQVAQTEEKLQQTRRMTREELQQGIKILEEEAIAQDRSTVDGQKKWEQLRSVIDQMNQELKEATGEWMKLADAQKIAEGAGKKGFAASAQEIQQATQALERRREELIKQIRAERDLGNAVDAQEKELDDLTKKLRSLKFEQDNVNMSQEKMRTLIETPANAVNLDELRAAIKRADGQLRQMQQSLGENSSEYKRFAEQVRNAKNVMKEMEGQSKASATAWEKAFSRLKTYVVMYMGFNEVWQKITSTMSDLLDLSDRMGEVRKTTKFTADEVGRLSENLKKMDVRTPLQELMSISASAGQLGLKSLEDVQGFTEAANKLMIALPEMGKEAATEMMRVAIATGEVDKIRKQLQEGTIEGSSATAVAMEKIASTIDRLRASSASTAPEITDFVKRVGAVGAQSGITIDQVAALGSTVSSLGMRVEMSATALSRMLPAIRNNAFEIAKSIGVTPETVRELFDAGRGMEVILMILQRMKDANMDADSIESMMGMGGMRDIMKDLNQQGARAGIVFAGLSQNVDELRRQLGVASEAYEENIAIQQEFNRMNDTTAAKWERLKNQIEELFVGDQAQRYLGSLIDGLRGLVDLITGPLKSSIIILGTFIGLLKIGLGTGLVTAVIKVIDVFKNWRIAIELTTMKLHAMKAAQWGNLFTAIAGSVLMLVLHLKQLGSVMAGVAKAIATLEAELRKEVKAVNELFHAVAKSNVELENKRKKLEEVKKAGKDATDAENQLKKANAEHAATIREINSKYGQYLGYMLSETSSAQQLAKARELINAKLRETITLKQREAALGNIEQEYGGKVNKRATAMEQTLQTFYGSDYDTSARVSIAITEAAEKYAKDSKGFQNAVKKILAQNKIQGDVADEYMGTFEGYRSAVEEYMKQEDVVNRRFEARTNVARKESREKAVGALNAILGDWKKLVDDYQKAEGEEKERLAAEVYKQQRNYANAYANNASYFENDNRKAVFDKNINNMKTYEKGLRSVAGEAIRTIDAMERAESKVTGIDYTNGGESGNNPWGGKPDAESTDWKNMTAEQLVNRRKQMKDFVNAIQTDTDVQSVLKEDAALKKAIEAGMSSDMRTVIEWYNTERLKIQDELHARHLTNTGDWMDPKKERGAKKQFRDEMDAYLHELDAYYTERKTRIEEAGTDEGLTEAEIRNRTLANEMEWRQRRAELQKLYSRKSAEVTREEQEAVFAIIAERTGDTERFVEQTIQKTNRFVDSIEKSGDKGAAIVHRWMSGVELETERDYLKQQQALTKQMKAIEDIIDKERPFNGITKQLRESLSTMDILTGDMRKEYDELMKAGKDMRDFNERQGRAELQRTTFLLGEAEQAYSTTIDRVMQQMREKGMGQWADWLSIRPEQQEALMAQLRQTYDSIQDAIKKEASQLKKQAEIMWNNILVPGGDGQTTLKQMMDRTVAQLGIDEGRVSRANSLIGAGVASERVADRLAIKQMQLQLTMQEHYYNLMKKQGRAHVDMLNQQADAAERRGDAEEATRKRLDAQHAEMALNLATAKEETELAKQREEIIARTQESQNRLYTELKEWADLLTSSLQSVMEASNAGNAEYYNERAKLDLTGKGGPGAGTYIVIDDAGTSDAKAHYEYLDERQALERQHEIEQQNAQAEAWKKVMDDINMKLSETITDQLNAMLQNQSIDANTDALLANTKAIYDSMGVETPSGEAKPGQPDVIAVQPQPDKPSAPVEPIVISGGSEPVVTQPSSDPENTAATNANTAALNTLTQVIGGQPAAGATDMGAAAGGGTTATAEGDVELQKPFFQMTEEETALAMDRIQQLWQAYSEGGATALQEMADTLAAQEGIVLPPWQITEEQLAVAMERMQALWQAYAEQGIEAMQMMSDAMEEMPNDIPNPMQVTEEQLVTSNENMQTAYQGLMDLSGIATEKVIGDQSKRQKGETETNKTMTQSSKNMYAAMTAAANLYGVAYQAMTNDNLSAEQKFQMIALQAAGQSAIAFMQTRMIESESGALMSLPEILAKCLSINPIAGAAIFAVLSALLGVAIGAATSKLAKGKSEVAQVTGASASAGKLATGMLTYAEGNVNEFTDPASLTPGRQYNVDGADGKTYRARYMGKDAKTHITNGPEFHLVGEKGREAIIDAHTTRLMQTDDTGIWQAIQTLYNGGRVSGFSTRRGRGVRAFAEGNVNDFEDISGSGMEGAEGFDDLTAMQDSLDRNTAVQEALLERLNQPIVAQNVWTGPEGIPNMVNKYQKEAKRHGVKYL